MPGESEGERPKPLYSSVVGAHLDEVGHIAVAAAIEERIRPMLE